MAKRNYDNNFPSVTQILDVLRKPELEYWFRMNTPEFCNEESKRGKEIGTTIHEAIQSYIETGTAKIETTYAEEVSNALKSFMKFREANSSFPLKRAEIALTSEKYKFNGTIDCLSDNLILDWKTGKCKDEEKPKIYSSYKYQVAAYVKLYNEFYAKNIERAIIVSVAKDKIAFDTYVMDKKEIDKCFKNVFLPALKILNYTKTKGSK